LRASSDANRRGAFPNDYEAHCLPALARRIVLEDRSLHCVAVYQALILHSDDDEQAFAEMLAILSTAAQ
jgi:hypothetical protein